MPLISLLRWQFDVSWSLFEVHLGALTDEDHLWEPTRGWVNAELMKNPAEVGQLRLLRIAVTSICGRAVRS